MTKTSLTLAAMLLAGSFGAANLAYAAETSPMDQAELNQLSPQVRQDVQSRLGSGETVHGVLETMLLNRVSQDFASGKIVATDFQRGEVVVAKPNGQMQAFPFDVETLQVHK